MPVTRRPPHRSRRAALPHRAPAVGHDAQARREPVPVVSGPALVADMPGTESGVWVAGADSLWPGPFPPPPPPSAPQRGLCSRASPVLRTCPTSPDRSSPSCSLGIHGADLATIGQAGHGDLPIPVRVACMHAQGLRPRGVATRLAMTARSLLPSACPYGVGTPEKKISRLDVPACMSPVNASPPSSRRAAHDSGPAWLAGPSL